MITGIWTIWQFAKSKATWIIGLLLLFGVMAVRIATTLIQTGEQNERLKTYEQSIRTTNKEKQTNAQIDRMSDASVRERMQHDWSRT